MRSLHSSGRRAGRWLSAALLFVCACPALALAQTPGTADFSIFYRQRPIGTEQVAVTRAGDRWQITSTGRVSAPLDLETRRLEAIYDREWKPLELGLDSTLRGQAVLLHTTVVGTTATTEVTPAGQAPLQRSEPIDASAVLFPNPYVAPYEAIAARLKDAPEGASFAIHQPGVGSFPAVVGGSLPEQLKTLDRTINAKRTRVQFRLLNAPPLELEIWGDETGRLLRVSIPAQGLEFVRADIASVSTRVVTLARPNDEDVTIPANGFSLAGTLSKPAVATGPLPAVILVGTTEPSGRDGIVAGIPVLAQIAISLADAGFLTLRYDTRGFGQSGGRSEAATLEHYAEDLRAAVEALAKRKDVDRKRLAIVGHGEGGWLALMVAAKTDRVAAVGTLATAGVSGADLNLHQLTHTLDRTNRSGDDRQRAIELQRSIQRAVLSGTGWDQIQVSPQVRQQADTPYFQSMLRHDPAKIVKDVKQPLLIVQGGRDPQIPETSADLLEGMAKQRKRGSVETLKVPELNHLLVPATTGETDEYGVLSDRTVHASVTTRLADWLRRSFAAVR